MTGPNLSEWSLKHKALIVYFMAVTLIAGIYAYMGLGRNEDPAFTIKTMVVQAYLPGAMIEETMQQLTDRIEKKLQETPSLDYLKSYTSPGKATVFVNLRSSVTKKEVNDIWYQVRKKIGDSRAEFPDGVVGPFFDDEFGDTYGIIYAFTADGFTKRELRDYAEKARDALLRISDVEKIQVLGAQDERIYIEFSQYQIAKLDIDKQALLSAIESQNSLAPSGTVDTGREKIIVEVTGKFLSEKDLAELTFVVGQKRLRLGDIATIKRGYADPPQPLFRVNGQNAIGLAISMRSGGDVLALEQNLQQAMDKMRIERPIGIEAHLVANQPHVVREAVGEFMKSLWEAVAIVLIISFISLGVRAGTVVSLSIPLVLAMVFIFMKIADIDLQRVSLGALIIALGLLVDDAMITVESMVSKLEQGWNSFRAATFAYTSTAFPMLTGTLVTMVGFVPIGFAKSDAGEYTFSLFAVVAIALLVSWFVAVLFAPLIGVKMLKEKTSTQHHEGKVSLYFRAALLWAMRHAKTTVATTVALFILSVAAIPLVPQQFFPSSDRPELLVDMTLPQSASLYASDAISRKLDALLKDNPDVDHWSAYVGRGAIRFYLPLDEQLQNDFFSQTVVVTKGVEARERIKSLIETAFAKDSPEVTLRVSPLELGPPVGSPVQYRVSGPDPFKVQEIAHKLAELMATNKDLYAINFNWGEPVRKLRIQVNQDRARELGVSSSSIAQTINATVTGLTTTQVRDSIYLIDVVVRAHENERQSFDSLRSLRVPLPNGKTAPLSELVTFDYTLDFPLVWRRDRLPTLTVQADVRGDVQPASVVADLQKSIATLQTQLPDGYIINIGGSVEESAKSQDSVTAVFPIMLFIMATILMIQLQNFKHLFLVASVAPLGVIGVVAALLIMRQPLGFVALLGIVALIGMIVRNSVILVHQIEVESAQREKLWDAVIEATVVRFRPIMLTAVAAILGMLPIAPTVFWGPMASAIMGGLAVATILTLIFLPALYVLCLQVRE